jgi:hypothetical protein
VTEGDATKRADVDSAMRGQDAVIDTIGGKTPWKETTLESSAARTHHRFHAGESCAPPAGDLHAVCRRKQGKRADLRSLRGRLSDPESTDLR